MGDPTWETTLPDWEPPAVGDSSTPSVARIYDYALGGKDNYAVDRAAAEKIIAASPDYREVARANRRFLVRALEYLCRRGVDQFIDLGSGLPTSPSVHEVVQRSHPGARVVYVDNDPIVMTHNRAMLRDPNVLTVSHDLREPRAVLDNPQVKELIDWDRPVGLLCVAVMHFVSLDEGPELISAYGDPLVPGSACVITAACSEGFPPEAIRRIEEVYKNSTAPLVLRTRSQIEGLFDGFALVGPGTTGLDDWSDDAPAADVLHKARCGVGVK